MNLLLASEFQGQPKVVKSKGFSVEKARAKVEACKIKKDLDKTNVDKRMNMYSTLHRPLVRLAVKPQRHWYACFFQGVSSCQNEEMVRFVMVSSGFCFVCLVYCVVNNRMQKVEDWKYEVS